MTFNGVINIDQEYYDFGKTQTVTAPQSALDLAQKIKEQNAANNQTYSGFRVHFSVS